MQRLANVSIDLDGLGCYHAIHGLADHADPTAIYRVALPRFLDLMASLGIEAIKTFAETGEKPANTEGLDFYNTGVQLVTDQPVDGIPSITSAEGLEKCWG